MNRSVFRMGSSGGNDGRCTHKDRGENHRELLCPVLSNDEESCSSICLPVAHAWALPPSCTRTSSTGRKAWLTDALEHPIGRVDTGFDGLNSRGLMQVTDEAGAVGAQGAEIHLTPQDHKITEEEELGGVRTYKERV